MFVLPSEPSLSLPPSLTPLHNVVIQPRPQILRSSVRFILFQSIPLYFILFYIYFIVLIFSADGVAHEFLSMLQIYANLCKWIITLLKICTKSQHKQCRGDSLLQGSKPKGLSNLFGDSGWSQRLRWGWFYFTSWHSQQLAHILI